MDVKEIIQNSDFPDWEKEEWIKELPTLTEKQIEILINTL